MWPVTLLNKLNQSFNNCGCIRYENQLIGSKIHWLETKVDASSYFSLTLTNLWQKFKDIELYLIIVSTPKGMSENA